VCAVLLRFAWICLQELCKVHATCDNCSCLCTWENVNLGAINGGHGGHSKKRLTFKPHHTGVHDRYHSSRPLHVNLGGHWETGVVWALLSYVTPSPGCNCAFTCSSNLPAVSRIWRTLIRRGTHQNLPARVASKALYMQISHPFYVMLESGVTSALCPPLSTTYPFCISPLEVAPLRGGWLG